MNPERAAAIAFHAKELAEELDNTHAGLLEQRAEVAARDEFRRSEWFDRIKTDIETRIVDNSNVAETVELTHEIFRAQGACWALRELLNYYEGTQEELAQIDAQIRETMPEEA